MAPAPRVGRGDAERLEARHDHLGGRGIEERARIRPRAETERDPLGRRARDEREVRQLVYRGDSHRTRAATRVKEILVEVAKALPPAVG